MSDAGVLTEGALPPRIDEVGLVFPASSPSKEQSSAALAAYLTQLVEEGYVQRQPQGFRIAWEALYRLLADSAHRSSLSLLLLPKTAEWIPALETTATPSERTFRVAVGGWYSAQSGIRRSGVQRVGACLRIDGAELLLTKSAWSLVSEVQALARQGSTWTPEQRLAAAGRIRALAKSGGALLDDYLERTDIVSTDHMRLDLVKREVLGAPLVEIRPLPDGVPPEWLASFDRYETVRARYDVSLPNGRAAHVAVGEKLQEALNQVKRLPGRRVASDEALLFLRNPFAVLGESAASAIDVAEFDESRRAAGIVFKHLQIGEEGAAGGELSALLVDPEGRLADEKVHMTREQAMTLLKTARRSRNLGLPLFAWEGEEIELSSATESALAEVERWLMAPAVVELAMRHDEVFDLKSYSDRVIGFDGATVGVPYVARKDADRPWIPENVELGILRSSESGANARDVRLTPEQIETLWALCREARSQGIPTVAIPGTDLRVPVPEAEHYVATFESGNTDREPAIPPLSKDPVAAARRPVLRILHNIEELNYGGAPPTGALDLEHERAELPASLRKGVELLPHQQSGLAWLQRRFSRQHEGIRGCLLADDMGLGKTLQALCLLAWYCERARSRLPCLVVAPVSLLENWKAELEKFFDGTQGPALSLYGEVLHAVRLPVEEVDPKLRSRGLQKFLRPGFESNYSIVLTTYETLRDYEFSLARVHWAIVICDEAQKIKTPGALVTRAAKALLADFRVACTGTPVENTLADLWCLFDFVQPGFLGSLNEFTRVFRRVIETRAEGHQELVEKLRHGIDPWVLRRLKTEVARMPQKFEGEHPDADPRCMRLPMSPLQRRLYDDVVGRFRIAMRDRDARAGILGILHSLRMICSHPLSIGSPNAEYMPVDEHVRHSPKLAWLLDRLSHVRQRGEKAIVFTEYRDIQRLLQRGIAQRFDVFAPIVNGSTSVDMANDKSRQRVIDRFQEAAGFGVIILSTTAVGFGVNIQAANHVIHFTRPWNPAKEDQATDRAHRIGQTKGVHVYCPTIVADGFETFDKRVDTLLSVKRALSRDMLAGVQEISLTDFEDL